MLDRERRAWNENRWIIRPTATGRQHAGCATRMRMAIIECVPNVSEGRRPEVVRAIVDAVADDPGRPPARLVVRRITQPFRDHARWRRWAAAGSRPDAVRRAASRAIDLRQHQGEHPRMGAVDVVPFVPIEGVTMADCAQLARETGEAVAERFGVPVFLYEEAASAPSRRNLEDIRRGEFEGLARQDAAVGVAAGFRAGGAAPQRRRLGDRRPHAAHRLQHQPRYRQAGRRAGRLPRRSGSAAAACAS